MSLVALVCIENSLLQSINWNDIIKKFATQNLERKLSIFNRYSNNQLLFKFVYLALISINSNLNKLKGY